MRIGGIVAAAGRGERLGAAVPKALVPLAGEPLVAHAVRALLGGTVDEVVVAVPADLVEHVRDVVPHAIVVPGGVRRQDSVRLALDALPDDIDGVLVHDAARPLTPSQLVYAVATAVRGGAQAVVPVIAVADTLKRVTDSGQVAETVDRARVKAVQTPQGFARDVLARAHEGADAETEATDDASLVEALGVPVQTVTGHVEAFKVTTPFDLEVAEALLAQRSRVGAKR